MGSLVPRLIWGQENSCVRIAPPRPRLVMELGRHASLRNSCLRMQVRGLPGRPVCSTNSIERVSLLQSEGCRFESCVEHHISIRWQGAIPPSYGVIGWFDSNNRYQWGMGLLGVVVCLASRISDGFKSHRGYHILV